MPQICTTMLRAISANILALSANVTAGAQPENTDWSALARSDIEAMHAATMAHHPGAIDTENPEFLTNSRSALTRGLSFAGSVETQAGYAYALRAYAAAYRDGHFGVSPETGDAPHYWPGFIATRRGDAWWVASKTSDTQSLNGMRITRCDGRSPDDWMREVIFGFGGNPDLTSDWSRRAARTFLERANPFVSRPQSCVFQSQDESIEMSLEWRETAYDDWSQLVAETQPRAEFGIRPFGENSYWIGIPTFGPRGDDLQSMQDMIAALREQAETMQQADVIVVDVRGNNGGASSWGRDIVDAIWGEAYAHYTRPPSSIGVDYRISDDNITHAQVIIDQATAEDRMRVAAHFEVVLSGMLAARDRGEGFFEQRWDPPEEPVEASNPVQARVFFLTDGACGSACLDFADKMLALDRVLHIGAETYADSAYMENRPVALPSGFARMGLPIKVYRGRARVSGQTYVPDILYAEADWSTEALQAWVTRLAQAED
jgi:hypothetical protein